MSIVLSGAALAPELPGSRFSMHGLWVGTQPGARRAGLGRGLPVSLEKWPAFHQVYWRPLVCSRINSVVWRAIKRQFAFGRSALSVPGFRGVESSTPTCLPIAKQSF
jgi:hypothetical protein